MTGSDVQLDVRVREATPQTCIIEVAGELTAFGEDALMAAYNEACRPGVSNVILDFAGLEHMSSSGIGLLVTLLIRAQRQGQWLVACGLNDHYCEIFRITRLDEAIAIYADRAAALAAIDGAGAQGGR